MRVQELKGRMQDDGYDVDAHAVAEALLAHMGHRALADALAARRPVNDDGPTRPGAAPADGRGGGHPVSRPRPSRSS